MNILIDIGHPADVHYFKHLIGNLKKKGHSIHVLARDKDVTQDLLNAYKIPFISKGKGGEAFFDRVKYILKSLFLLRKVIKKIKPDICVSHASPYLAVMAARYKLPHIMFNDTERAVLFKHIVKWCKPNVFSPESFLQKNISGLTLFPSFMELAYLHPDLFQPGIDTSKGSDKSFILFRFVANKATHDYGEKHLNENQKTELFEILSDYSDIKISSESELPEKLQPYQIQTEPHQIHQLLYKADLLIGDSATMSSEAAMLGVPAIFINQSKLGYIKELEEKYELVKQFSCDEENFKKAVQAAESILKDQNRRETFQKRKEKMLSEKKNLTKIMVQLIRDTEEKIRNNII